MFESLLLRFESIFNADVDDSPSTLVFLNDPLGFEFESFLTNFAKFFRVNFAAACNFVFALLLLPLLLPLLLVFVLMTTLLPLLLLLLFPAPFLQLLVEGPGTAFSD